MFLKKHFTIIGLACVLSVPAVDAGAEGFAINEWSAEGVAMGGARMFAENDAANIAYNPASITKVRGEAFKQSAVYISPHGKYKAKGRQHHSHCHVAVHAQLLKSRRRGSGCSVASME